MIRHETVHAVDVPRSNGALAETMQLTVVIARLLGDYATLGR